jgi:hypothetical protein
LDNQPYRKITNTTLKLSTNLVNVQQAFHAIRQEYKKLKEDLNEMLTDSSFSQQQTTTLGSL